MVKKMIYPRISTLHCTQVYFSKFSTMTLVVLSLCLTFGLHARADEHAASDLKLMANNVEINDAWARSTFALAKTGALYFSITNNGAQNVQLLSVSVDSSVAMIAELHHTVLEDDMMRMQELEDGINIKTGDTVELLPGGMHVMLMGLTGPLNAGGTVDLELHFSDDSHTQYTFPIQDRRN
jgi:hypothetical protein